MEESIGKYHYTETKFNKDLLKDDFYKLRFDFEELVKFAGYGLKGKFHYQAGFDMVIGFYTEVDASTEADYELEIELLRKTFKWLTELDSDETIAKEFSYYQTIMTSKLPENGL